MNLNKNGIIVDKREISVIIKLAFFSESPFHKRSGSPGDCGGFPGKAALILIKYGENQPVYCSGAVNRLILLPQIRF